MKSKSLLLGFLLLFLGLSFIFLYETDAEVTAHKTGRNLALNGLLELFIELLGRNFVGGLIACIGLFAILRNFIHRKKNRESMKTNV
jgi:hypothetical protein